MLFSSCLFPFLLVTLSVPLQSQAQTTARHNITVGSILHSAGPNTSWLSPSGEFAFGFRALDGNASAFLVAIWFVNTAESTIVWYANGDKPAPIGSTLQFISYGLSLQDPSGQVLSISTSVNGASYASMSDKGNFVIYNSVGKPLWQSFGYPSDTILPSQVLQLGTTLTSHLMATDYTTGRFRLSMQGDGNLVFYTIALVSEYQYGPYWASNTVGNGTSLVFNETGNIYLVMKNDTWLNVTSGPLVAASDFYQRATLDNDGVFRRYVHPKKSSTRAKGGWNNGWTMVGFWPQNICDSTDSTGGSGICGFNSYCIFNSSQSIDCECPQYYSFLDPNRKYKGCFPDFSPQSCIVDESDQFELLTISNLDWPLADYEEYSPIDIETCRQQCLTDCFCSVAVFDGNSCWKKKIPLSNGKMGSFVDRTLLLKVPKNNRTQSQDRENDGWKKDKKAWILGGSLLLGSSVSVNVLLILVVILGSHYYQNKRKKKIPMQRTASLSKSPRAFAYKELESATNEFSEEVGRGGSGEVYRGYLHQHEQVDICIAVKKLDSHVLANTEKEFITEVQTIGQTFHRNLVRLLGFCKEGPHRLLIFEFMNNGSLNDWLLNNSTRPSWNQRVQVALGIARGLLYLHEECSIQIIHCDMKPQNILLDDNLTPKISDFGLAKLLKTDQTRTNTGIRGTKGYVAPEWFKNVGITSKVDVYSFGVILLEIVCCRRNVEQEIEDEERVVLAYWVNDCYRDGRLDLVVPTWDEDAAQDMRRIERFVKIALWCIQEEPSLRPTMLKVTQMLDGAVEIPIPPDPSSYMSTISS